MDFAAPTTNPAQDILLSMAEVLHSLQRERGCASIFLDSEGKYFTKRLNKQINRTSKLIANLSILISDSASLKDLPDFIESRLSALNIRLQSIGKLRAQVLKDDIKYTKAINDYTFSHNIPLLDDMIELAQRTDEHNSALVSAFANFLQWKERLGRERALGTRGFYKFAFKNPEFCDRIIALTAEQQTYLNSFLTIASPSQIALVRDILDGSDMKTIADFHLKLEAGDNLDGHKEFTAESWFDILTRTMDQLHNAEKKLIMSLAGAATHVGNLHSTDLESGVKVQKPFLKSLALFSKLEDTELDDLLSFAQIRHFESGKILFLQGESIQRMYVILEGWVKIFNGTETGEETVLQMLSTGETLLDSAIFLNAAAPVSAQLIEDATLLSIPAPVMRQKVKDNGNLAISMLSNVSLRSQRLIHQIEQSRLKSARERVGWFLLRLYLNQANQESEIFLPYDKSIIASYLDMRPETFSRALKKLRSDGFVILKDRISIPKDKSLCAFCDQHLAGTCDFVGTPNCSNPNIADLDLVEILDA